MNLKLKMTSHSVLPPEVGKEWQCDAEEKGVDYQCATKLNQTRVSL